jgi:hypothetical protein
MKLLFEATQSTDKIMETFTEPKGFVENSGFSLQRQACLEKWDISSIDAPIVDIVKGFSELSYCFTLQSCCGHFLHTFQNDPYNIDPLPQSDRIKNVEYRIAYIALCIENSDSGIALFKDLKRIPLIDEDYIQFGSAEWFWERQVNSYALQVEPNRHMKKDKIIVDYKEALYLQETKNRFFAELRYLIRKRR